MVGHVGAMAFGLLFLWAIVAPSSARAECLRRVVVNDEIVVGPNGTMSRQCGTFRAKSVTFECANADAKITRVYDTCRWYDGLRTDGAAACLAWRDTTAPFPGGTSGCDSQARLTYTFYAGRMVSGTPTSGSAMRFHNERYLRSCGLPDIDVNSARLVILNASVQTQLAGLVSAGKPMQVTVRCNGGTILEKYLTDDPDATTYYEVRTHRTTLPAPTVARPLDACTLVAVEELKQATRCASSSKKGVTMKPAQLADKASKVLEELGVDWYHSWSIDGFAETPTIRFLPVIADNEFSDYTARIDNLVANVNTLTIPLPDTLFGFNEPERERQANIPVAMAIEDWPELVGLRTGIDGRILPNVREAAGIPFMRIGSPAVGWADGGTAGKLWLQTFHDGVVPGTATTPQFVVKNHVHHIAIHWHGDSTDPEVLKRHLTEVYDLYRKPIWITELSPADWGEGEAKKPGKDCAGNYVCDTREAKVFEDCNEDKLRCIQDAWDTFNECLIDLSSDTCKTARQTTINACGASWLTCDSAADTKCREEFDPNRANHHDLERMKQFMSGAIPWLESTPWIQGYAWYSHLKPTKPQNCTARLYEADGTLTPLGKAYAAY